MSHEHDLLDEINRLYETGDYFAAFGEELLGVLLLGWLAVGDSDIAGRISWHVASSGGGH